MLGAGERLIESPCAVAEVWVGGLGGWGGGFTGQLLFLLLQEGGGLSWEGGGWGGGAVQGRVDRLCWWWC